MQFILNDKEVNTQLPGGTLLLDFIRYHKKLTGTKIGCREGDCGACTVLIGELIEDELRYRSVTSCLTPIGNVHGKHVVTVEGINTETLNPIQQAMNDEGATQCGFCTPGFVVSLAGFCLSKSNHTYEDCIAAIDGNICRCTGYKSIERAAKKVSDLMLENKNEEPIEFTAKNKILPAYFTGIKKQLKEIQKTIDHNVDAKTKRFVGGGTDLYVQKPEEMIHADIHFAMQDGKLKGISFENNICTIGAASTVTDLMESDLFNQYFPQFKQQVKLVSSTPIRNLATFAGNFVNASPIGDFTIFFLALNASLQLSNGTKTRTVALKDFYKGYKEIDKHTDEFVEKMMFDIPSENTLFNFEKVSKRANLDIASVNSAMQIKVRRDGQTSVSSFEEVHVSAGGVSPIPLYLSETSGFLTGKELSDGVILQAIDIAQSEISPISDARGSIDYKRLLLRQLMLAHFHTLFPEIQIEKLLYAQ
ncbi:MAG: 2Fe-2S iron-sulfur cluster binding protein [Bacteroidota bacterium]|nr:2Fe-2S iron-sulfur cluster binding protein [Bacteroidota bacterium]